MVLDAEPPALQRRGDSARRSAVLSNVSDRTDVAAEVARRGAVETDHLRRLGLLDTETAVPDGVLVVGEWWLDRATFDDWQLRLYAAVEHLGRKDPLSGGMSRGGARDFLAVPDDAVLDAVVRAAGLEQHRGRIRLHGAENDLGAAEPAVTELEARLRASPFQAPEAYDLDALGLGARELAAAERAGRLLRLRDGVVLLPTAPALAMRALAALDQPFTTSQARQALETTRRVAIPLLEHLDGRGWTRRLDAGHRAVVR